MACQLTTLRSRVSLPLALRRSAAPFRLFTGFNSKLTGFYRACNVTGLPIRSWSLVSLRFRFDFSNFGLLRLRSEAYFCGGRFDDERQNHCSHCRLMSSGN